MKLRIMSDLHLEFGGVTIPVMPDEHEQILILAGDIGTCNSLGPLHSFFKEMDDRFRAVVRILGNHEFYHGSFRKVPAIARALVNQFNNIFLLDDDYISFGNVHILGSTLWTDFNEMDPPVVFEAQCWMNDYKLIRNGTETAPRMRRLRPIDTIAKNLTSKVWLFDTIDEIQTKKDHVDRIVVLSHHAPTPFSIPERYKNAKINGAYANKLALDIEERQANLWIHGHTHDSFDYKIGETRVICNPRGYFPDDLNPNFRDTFVVEV